MMRRAFTLVELLVVVTIIVVLLAMLLPAMGRAIYLAKLAQCAGQQKTTAVGIQTYAFDSRRFYPHRQLPRQEGGKTAPLQMLVGGDMPDGSFVPIDLRPQLKPYVQINKQLNDPFVDPINLEFQSPTRATTINCSYNMFFGWRYGRGARRYAAMEKIGDVWEYGRAGAGQPVRAYNILLGDIDLIWNYGATPSNISASHPDIPGGDRPRLWLHTVEDRFEITYGSNAIQSYWIQYTGGGIAQRQLMDMNNAYDDGSVRQLTGLEREDVRYDWVPYFFDLTNETSFRTYIPKR